MAEPEAGGVTAAASVTLEPVTGANRAAVIALLVDEAQRAFVASNEISLAQAETDPGAWYRSVCADGIPVGFVMLHDETLCEEPNPRGMVFLWRMMIDRHYQGMGFGRRAIGLLIAHARTRPDATRLYTSWREEPGNAARFYEKPGFETTGTDEHGEVQAFVAL